MSRRPARAVQVRCTAAGEPEQFLRGSRLYVVRSVLAHWREATRWWTTAATGSALEVERNAIDRDVWRVEATAGRSGVPGVFELAHLTRGVNADATGSQDCWVLVRVYD